MAIYPDTKKPDLKEKRNVALPLMIAAGVVLIILMGWLYQKNFGPAPIPQATGVAKTNHDYIEGLYNRTNGDYSKVSAEEKQKIDAMTMGHGQVAFQTIKQ